MSLSEDRLIGLYRLNQHLLDAALTMRSPGAEVLATAASGIAGIGNELDRGEANTSEAVAKYTGLIFSCIAQLSGNAHVVKSVQRINDRLHCIRVLERAQLNDVDGELMIICESFLAEQFKGTAKAVAKYHTRRLTLLPELIAALRE